ncbi:MAG: ABC transporter ATP-binding protein [Brevinematia bacterium]
MRKTRDLLEVEEVEIIHKKSGRSIVREISFGLREGEILGIVGESGSGKSITMHSILGILPDSLEARGSVFFEGEDILDEKVVRRVRGTKIAMIFQDPLNALNPVLRIGDQLRKLSESHKLSYEDVVDRVRGIFERIGIYSWERVLKSFPHQLSGGMLQRVVIAFVLLLKPKIVIADEPTTSLDVSTQKEIIAILREIRDNENVSIIFITHDLLLAKELCDRIVIMYSGYIVEKGESKDIFGKPLHPYTRGLISSVPTVNVKPSQLSYIPGRVPHFLELGLGCPFAERCGISEEICFKELPSMRFVGNSEVRCFLAEKSLVSK